MPPEPAEPLVFLTRPGCCLCDRLWAMVTEHLDRPGLSGRFTLSKRNIDGDPELARAYGDRVPVIMLNGQPVLEGNPTPADVAAALV